MTPKKQNETNSTPRRKELEDQAFALLMQLDDKQRQEILAPYRERYGIA